MKQSDQDRFWSKVHKTDSCWLWTKGKCAAGYGNFFLKGRDLYAHRVAYELEHGVIPDGKQVDHTCWNHACVNPSHLRILSQAHNLQNRSGANKDSGTGIRGVGWQKNRKKWQATGSLNGKRIHLGLFGTIEEAETAVIAWRRENMPYSLADQGAPRETTAM